MEMDSIITQIDVNDETRRAAKVAWKNSKHATGDVNSTRPIREFWYE
jgi:hypothetical protein